MGPFMKVNSITVAAKTMNGTFAGYINVATFFTYCGRSPPYTDQGGGNSSSTKYQVPAAWLQHQHQLLL